MMYLQFVVRMLFIFNSGKDYKMYSKVGIRAPKFGVKNITVQQTNATNLHNKPFVQPATEMFDYSEPFYPFYCGKYVN